MSSCTESRANSNYERFASYSGCQFPGCQLRTPGLRISSDNIATHYCVEVPNHSSMTHPSKRIAISRMVSHSRHGHLCQYVRLTHTHTCDKKLQIMVPEDGHWDVSMAVFPPQCLEIYAWCTWAQRVALSMSCAIPSAMLDYEYYTLFIKCINFCQGNKIKRSIMSKFRKGITFQLGNYIAQNRLAVVFAPPLAETSEIVNSKI